MKNWIDLARVARETKMLEGRDLRGVDLSFQNLRRANCRDADFQSADCRGADFDFSCWPLWCGSKNVKVDGRIARQLLLHACSLDLSGDPDEDEYLDCVAACLDFISKSHRYENMTGGDA